jgi:hypothetical protein
MGGMGEESGVWCVSNIGAHNEDLGVVKVCAVGADDPVLLRMNWAQLFIY